jgi:L-asparagine transporter-like permease
MLFRLFMAHQKFTEPFIVYSHTEEQKYNYPNPPSTRHLSSQVITVAAAETVHPRRNIPKAVRRTFWRVLIFYVLGVLAIGVLVPYNDPNLNSAIKNDAPGAASSPWVAAIRNSGISVLPHIVNAVSKEPK